MRTGSHIQKMWRDQLGQKGNFGGSGKAEQSKKCMHDLCLSPEHSIMSCVSPGVEGVECWKVGFRELTQGGLAVKRQPEVTGLRAPQPGKFTQKTWDIIEARHHC